MINKFIAFNFPSWSSQEVIEQVPLPTPQKRADVLMTQHWVPVRGGAADQGCVMNSAIADVAAAICMQQSYL